MKSPVIAAAAAAILATAPAAGAHGVRGKPSLRLTDAAPLSIRGLNFRPAERVRVAAGPARARVVRASATGTFVATFSGTTLDRCSGGFTIVAIGSRGSTARLKLPELECPPTLGP